MPFRTCDGDDVLNIETLLQEQLAAASLVFHLQKDLLTAPTLQTFENAAQAAYDPSQATSLGLKPLLDSSGNTMTETLPSGMSASAFLDARGNVVIAYQGTITSPQYQLDVAVLSGTSASKLQGFSDALDFASKVQAVAKADGIAQNHVYVTGHSLGGTLASYVASQTGLGGTAFASSGVPGYQAPSIPAANFVTYVEKGDPFANYATDAAEKASAVVANPSMDHYGTVVSLGSAADAAELQQFSGQIAGYSIGAALTGGALPAGTQLASLENGFNTLMGEHHNLSGYDADAASAIVPASAYGLQNTSMTQFMASMATDAKALLVDLPKIFSAPSPTAALGRFAGDFPDLAREVTSMMHADSFQAAIGELATVDPTLYKAATSVQGMTAIINTFGHHSVGLTPFHVAA